MALIDPVPTPNSIEKQYPYRYAWPSTLGLLLTGMLGAIGMTWLALSKGGIGAWALALFFFLLFLGGIWIVMVNIQGKLKLIITKDGIYMPSIWKPGKHTFIPFSQISEVEFLDVYGNMIFQLSIGNKKYPITHTWLPSEDVYQEVVEAIQERLPAHLK